MLSFSKIQFDSFAETDVGLVRSENEDALLLHVPATLEQLEEKGVLAVVADGVGGGNSGKTASSLAVSVMQEHYYASTGSNRLLSMKEAMLAAHRAIVSKAHQNRSMEGMATTCTAFLLLGSDGFVCHAGDSRAYVLRSGNLRQLTEDHTLVNKLLQDGLLTSEAAQNHPQRNIIVKALGSDEEPQPDTIHLELEDNDIILLSSDGLHGLVPDGAIASILTNQPLRQAGSTLINLAKRSGGTDNITVILLQVFSKKKGARDTAHPTIIGDTKKRTTVLIALIFALLSGSLLYFWAAYGLNKIAPPGLSNILRINK